MITQILIYYQDYTLWWSKIKTNDEQHSDTRVMQFPIALQKPVKKWYNTQYGKTKLQHTNPNCCWTLAPFSKMEKSLLYGVFNKWHTIEKRRLFSDDEVNCQQKQNGSREFTEKDLII